MEKAKVPAGETRKKIEAFPWKVSETAQEVWGRGGVGNSLDSRGGRVSHTVYNWIFRFLRETKISRISTETKTFSVSFSRLLT